MLRDTSGVKEHLRDGMTIWYSGNSIKYMKGIQMRSPNYEEWGWIPPGHLLSPKKASSGRTEFHQIELLAKEYPEIHKQTRDALHKLTTDPHC